MRALFLVTAVAITGGGNFFNPPCTRLSKVVCDLGPEGDVCAFVLAADRKDERAQAMCEEILPTAIVYSEDRSDPEARAAWAEARTRLASLGFKADEAKGRIGEKLKAAGGQAGKMVEKLENAYEQEQNQMEERAKEIFKDLE